VICPVRLRQVVVITNDLATIAAQVEADLGLRDPYVDPGVAEFGLENRVFAVGDCFLEVLTPIADGSAGGRYLERRGGDSGYMAIFQLDDLETARKRVADLGIRIVWQRDLGDISGTHLHPADVPGAIVSLDWANPAESWHWAGPAWTGQAPGSPQDRAGGITSLTVAAVDPAAMAARWSDVLGRGVDGPVDDAEGVALTLADAGQVLRFVPAADARDEAIVGCGLALAPRAGAASTPIDVGGVRFTIT
jgi:hypothetical protein